jgi:ABC-type lipoprotein release transport system permease subunit
VFGGLIEGPGRNFKIASTQNVLLIALPASPCGSRGLSFWGIASDGPCPPAPEALIVAPLFAIGVGVSSGFYPAWKASQLDPITALRLE